MASRTMIAWAAGLFEGEGWINIRPQSRNNGISVRLGLQMTDLDVLRKFLDAVEVKREPYSRKREEKRKQIWCIEINRREDVRRILTNFLPFQEKDELQRL